MPLNGDREHLINNYHLILVKTPGTLEATVGEKQFGEENKQQFVNCGYTWNHVFFQLGINVHKWEMSERGHDRRIALKGEASLMLGVMFALHQRL